MKKVYVLVCLLFLSWALPVFAKTADQIVVGGIYYYNQFNNNVKVRVTKVGTSNGYDAAEVIYMEGSRAGEVDYVYTQHLLTGSESQAEAVEDAVQTGVIALGLLCALTSCTDNNK